MVETGSLSSLTEDEEDDTTGGGGGGGGGGKNSSLNTPLIKEATVQEI